MRLSKWLWPFLLIASLTVAAPAFAGDASYAFPKDGLRVYLPDTWQVITLKNLDEKELQISQTLGTTAEALEASFVNSGTLIEAYSPNGGQYRLTVRDLPSGFPAVDACYMTTKQRDQFLHMMEEEGGFEHGQWSTDLPEFAVFRAGASLQALQIRTIAYITVRYGMLYTVTTDIIGREPIEEDEASLHTLAASILFLGDKATPAPEATTTPRATLDLSPTPTPQPAEIKVQRDETYLSLDYAPSVSQSTQFTLTGTTDPDTPMRYYVNGKGYDRFTSDSEGRFTCFVRELPKKGKNLIAVYAIGEKGYGVLTFSVLLDQQKTPLVVTPFNEGVAGNKAVICGQAAPGANVQILFHSKTYEPVMADDGSFTADVDLGRLGQNTFTIRASMPSFLRNEVKLTIERLKSQADEQEDFQKKLKHIAYDRLINKPEAYKGTQVKYQGKVLALSGQNGQPLAVILTEGDASPVALLSASLQELEKGREITALCTLTGQTREVTLAGVPVLIPEANLIWLLPNE